MQTSTKEDLKFVLLTLSVVGVILVSSYFLAKHFGLTANFLNLFSTADTYEVKTAPDHLPISTKPPESLDISDITEIRQMLQNKQFDRLNASLETYQIIFERDQIDEYKVYDAYSAFYITSSSYEDLLKTWGQTTPDKYQPYLAIAQYYYAKGWESRGYKFRKDTSEKQFEDMGYYFGEAEKNLNRALEINPNLMMAYHTMIGIYNAEGEDDLENWAVEKASALFPHSFLIQVSASWAKEPKWGGSLRQMEKLAEHAQKYSDINPKLSVLYGLIYYYQADRFTKSKAYDRALDMYRKALSYGEHWEFYNARARMYHYDLKAYDKALDDVNRSIELRPVLYENRLMRSRIYYAQGEYAESMEDLHTAEMISPGNSEIERWKKWASGNMMKRGHGVFKTDLGQAVGFYDTSLEFNKDNFEVHYWRGRALVNMQDLEAALSDFKAAVELNPHHFESYRMIDYIYSRNQQWDEIINYWNQLIELEPDNADAYFERAGTYHHNHDMARAMDDLKTACDLGNKDACKRYDMTN